MWDACARSSLTLDMLDHDHGHNKRPILETKWCWNRSAGPGLPRLTIRKPRFVDSASIMAANVHIHQGGCLRRTRILLFTWSAKRRRGTTLRHFSRSECDQVAMALLQEQGSALNVCLASAMSGTCTPIARQNQRQTIWAST